MRLSYALVFATLAAFVSCQNPNSFEIPASGSYPPLTAGQPYTFMWDNLSGSTVTLTLRDGSSTNLNQGTVIKANVPNTGSYTYTPPTSTPAGTTYTIEISNDQDPTQVNYTPSFQIISSATASASASGSTTMSGSMTSTDTASNSITSTASGSTSTGSTATGSTSTMTSISTQTTGATTSNSATVASSATNSAAATQKTGGAMQNGAKLLHAGAGLVGVALVVML